MAHEVERMFYVGTEPWHGLGTKIPEGKQLTMDEGIMAAGLDWEVELRNLYTLTPQKQMIGLVDQRAVCRTSDNSILGIVGPDYTPLQNRDAFRWFQPFLESGEAVLETAGSLRCGRKVWVLARIAGAEAPVNGDDVVCHYLLLSNSHDGSLAVRVGFTPIRVVCNNTLCMAHESEASKLLRVKHTARLLKNLEDIREIVNLARKEFAATIGQYQRLSAKEINNEDLKRYVTIVFEIKDTRRSVIYPEVVRLFNDEAERGMAGPTLWGAYNAVNTYLNYFRGKTQDNTLDSLWFGDSAAVNSRALTEALTMAA